MKVPGFFDDDIHGNDGAGDTDLSARSNGRQQQRRSRGANKREDDLNSLVEEDNRGVRPRLSPWR